MDELWGTLSIYDHRQPIFRNALLLFDRIVAPLPDKPIYELTEEELDKLAADISYLEENQAAIGYPWSSDEFGQWQEGLIREALSVGPRDSLYDTRLMLGTKVHELKPPNVSEVTAIPVYGSRVHYETVLDNVASLPEQALTIAISKNISVPNPDTPLEAIIELRKKESFRSSVQALRTWQYTVLPEILDERGERVIRAAATDFEKMLHRYEKAIEDAQFKRIKIWVVSLVGLAGAFAAAIPPNPSSLAILGAAIPAICAFSQLKQPIWKQLEEKPYAPAAVVYEANRELARFSKQA